MKTLIKILCLSVLWFSCEEEKQEIEGCTYDSACNFDENATLDDGSCTYSEENYDCDGNCIIEEDCNGECGGDGEYNTCNMCSNNGDFDCFIGTWKVVSLISDDEEMLTEDFYNENGHYLFEFTSDQSLILSLTNNNEFVFPNYTCSINNLESILNLYNVEEEDIDVSFNYLFNGTEILSLDMVITSETDPANQIISLEKICNTNNIDIDNDGICDDIDDCVGEYDDCGVCNGENSYQDDCGVCFGENSDQDCNGDCFGDAVVDECGVCDGNNESMDLCGNCAGQDLEWVELWGECYNIETTTELYFNNQLTGTIPSEIGNLTNLEYLRLYNNELSGEIPSEIGNLSKLKTLSLWRNELSGEIPPDIGNLINLTDLSISDNQITGEIPSEIGQLINLTRLDLDNNQLMGEIPSEICNQGDNIPSVAYNNLCPIYPDCISQNDINSQNTSDCLYLFEDIINGEYDCDESSQNACPLGNITCAIVSPVGTVVDYFDITPWGGPHRLTIEDENGFQLYLIIWPDTWDISNDPDYLILLEPPYNQFRVQAHGNVFQYEEETQILICSPENLEILE